MNDLQALDDLPTFDMNGIEPFYPPVIDESKLANVGLRLDEDRRLTTTQTERLFAVLDRSRSALKTLECLPQPHQAIHCVLRGAYALFDFVGAILQLAGQPIDALHCATLGFSKRNIDDLAALVNAGQVRTVSILCSHYFSAGESKIYTHAAGFCEQHGFPITAMRVHAKILLLAAGPHRITIESSANLRSCVNVETATVFASPELFDFHAAWISELIQKGQKPCAAENPTR